MNKFIDIHTHSTEKDIDNLSISNIILNQPYQIKESQKYSIGLHPWFLNKETIEIDLQNLNQMAGAQQIIAIGEIGLDRITKTDFNTQIEVFEKQIAIAERHNLPIIIHCVRAFSELIAIKRRSNPKVPLIIHGFNQNSEILTELIRHNFYISIGAAILNTNFNSFKHFTKIPSNRLFLETDNSQISIKLIYKKASEILQLTEKELIAIINQNFQSVFQHNI